MRKWLEITNEHKPSDFWTNVLKRKSPEDFSPYKNTLTYDIYQDEQHTFVIVEMPGVYEEELTLRLLSRTRLHIRGNITPFFQRTWASAKTGITGKSMRRLSFLNRLSPACYRRSA